MSKAQQSDVERQIQEREKQRNHESEQERLRQAFNQQGDLDRDWMKEILGTDDLEEYLDPYELDKVRGLVNQQWVLANLSDAQTHDRWYKLEVMKLKVIGSFPPDESEIQGPLRAVLLSDEKECLTSLTAEQRNVIDQIFMSLQNMVTRSTDGFERKQFNTNYARTEREGQPQQKKKSGRLGGLF